ncbi:MAG: SDR family NAD(P)-dependent oxidoreductase, partial [Geminicoccaceae bacterium]|nr:SDR family NAD(P)-dependent oxidoreductase [Geminicoccaceae bacterium]
RTQGALVEVDDRVRAQGGRATLVPLDLTAEDGIERLGGALAERHGRLDALVGNAAILGPLTPASHLTPAELTRVMALNLIANQRLIRSMEPLLRAAPAGRAVFVTAAEARAHKPFWSAYAMSKAALEALVSAWAAELQRSPVRVNLVMPPPMPTRLRAEAFPGERPDRLARPEDQAGWILACIAPDYVQHGQLVHPEHR